MNEKNANGGLGGLPSSMSSYETMFFRNKLKRNLDMAPKARYPFFYFFCSSVKVQIHFRKFSTERKISADRMRITIFSLEKIVLRMRSAENFPFRGKFSEVYIHLNFTRIWKKNVQKKIPRGKLNLNVKIKERKTG